VCALAQVCSALRALHSSGIVHRNINPNCILIDANGWLVLGGSMFVRQPKRTSRQYTVCGLPDYLPPEAIQGRGYNRMADIWMLGVLVFEMVMGKPPFNGQDPLDNMRLILTNSSNVEALPGAAQDLVTKLLAPAPQDRLGFARCV
jgi:serine/threonine protein kinase